MFRAIMFTNDSTNNKDQVIGSSQIISYPVFSG